MALITDPDNLNQGTEVTINTSLKTITLNIAGNLTTDGVTLKCLYSFLKEEWKTDLTLIKFPFPILPITDEQFEVQNGWDFGNDATRYLIRNAGWALKSIAGVTQEEWAGIITLGSIGGTDQVYFQQEAAGAATNIQLTGVVNQAIKIYGDLTHGNFNYRSYLTLFVRTYQMQYAQATLLDIGVTGAMTYQAYRFPLANAADLKITHDDTTVDTTLPYTGMTITWYAAAQARPINGTDRYFHVIIDGNNATAEQIYEFVQRELRKNVDIDDGSGSTIGKTASELLQFVGDTLKTKYQVGIGGVYIDNYQIADTNRLINTDDTNTPYSFPFVAALTINFGDNLVNDADAIYRVFFTNDDAGLNLGYDFGTANAITVQDNSLAAMAGAISGSASIQKTFNYDGNVQRGGTSAGVDAPITVVALGLSTGQYVKAVGTINRSTTNTVSLVASLERNYLNV